MTIADIKNSSLVPMMIALVSITLASVLGYSMRDQDKSLCAHNWSPWGEVHYTHDWLSGTGCWQNRTCIKCGRAEVRSVRRTRTPPT